MRTPEVARCPYARSTATSAYLCGLARQARCPDVESCWGGVAATVPRQPSAPSQGHPDEHVLDLVQGSCGLGRGRASEAACPAEQPNPRPAQVLAAPECARRVGEREPPGPAAARLWPRAFPQSRLRCHVPHLGYLACLVHADRAAHRLQVARRLQRAGPRHRGQRQTHRSNAARRCVAPQAGTGASRWTCRAWPHRPPAPARRRDHEWPRLAAATVALSRTRTASGGSHQAGAPVCANKAVAHRVRTIPRLTRQESPTTRSITTATTARRPFTAVPTRLQRCRADYLPRGAPGARAAVLHRRSPQSTRAAPHPLPATARRLPHRSRTPRTR